MTRGYPCTVAYCAGALTAYLTFLVAYWLLV